jgi:sugar lactone lactonase YvrE
MTNLSGLSRGPLRISVAAALLLAGCGGSELASSPLSAMPQSPTNSLRHAHSGALLFVSNDGDEHNVTVYRAGANDPNPIRTISSDLEQPGGICLDGQGTLYVTDTDGWVVEYLAGKTKSSKIITEGINTPADCAIDDKGNLWVTNIGGPNVTEYLKGSTKPHLVITNGLTYPDGIAVSHSGNMYVGNGGHYGEGPYSIVIYEPGSKSPSETITDGVTGPVGITVDAHDTLYVANDDTNNVEEYRFGRSHPYKTITSGVDAPAGITVNKKGWLYVVNLGNAEVVEFAPGSITPSGRKIDKGLLDPFGAAYSPPLLP